MGTKQVRLDEDVYDRISAHKRDGESFSETIERLTSGYSLVEFAENTSGDAETHRNLLEQSAGKTDENRREHLREQGIDVE
jgi:predicted CopG family antitoxin